MRKYGDKIKIYDCVTYYKEDRLLNLRFNFLDKFVDYFVIVECSHTHNGKYKGQNFDLNKFSNFKEKIIYAYIDISNEKELLYKSNMNGFVIENYQRNQILYCLKNAKDEDIVIISDCDEIPNLSTDLLHRIKNVKFYKYFFLYKKCIIISQIFSYIQKKKFICH